MAGSLRTFIYTDGLGTNFVINRDESNIKAVNGTGATEYTGNPVINYGLPPNITPRTARYVGANQSLEVVVLSSTVTPPARIYSNQYALTLVKDEVRKVFPSVDTGLTDGTPASP